MTTHRLLLLATLLLCGVQAPAQDWEQEWENIKKDSLNVWGEGWGTSLEEADTRALTALISKISVEVKSDFRMEEEQVQRGRKDSYARTISSRSAAFSRLTLSNTYSIILPGRNRQRHVGRWIRRDELERLFAGRESRILEFERSALEAQMSGRLDDALRWHYSAYVLTRSLQHPSELLDEQGRMLLNTVPERINKILDDVRIRKTGRSASLVTLDFSFRGIPVKGLDFSWFDGAHWVSGGQVRNGAATINMAPGALAETLQLRIEYAYRSDADGELYDFLATREEKPLKKAFIVFQKER